MNPLQELLHSLTELENRKIFHRLSRVRPEANVVEIAVPGERREVEIFADGAVEVKVFGPSQGIIVGEEVLHRLSDEFSERTEQGADRKRLSGIRPQRDVTD